jgi:hypothetical protein
MIPYSCVSNELSLRGTYCVSDIALDLLGLACKLDIQKAKRKILVRFLLFLMIFLVSYGINTAIVYTV